MDMELFERNPRAYALELVESGLIDAKSLLTDLLVYMSFEEVQDALDCSELSPRMLAALE